VGNSLGPLLATSIVAHYYLLILYLAIAGLTLGVLFAFLTATRRTLSR